MEKGVHRPVLLQETVEVLQPAAGRKFLDATFGRGGHSRLLMEAGAQVLGIDRDPEAIAAGQAMATQWETGQLEVRKMNFKEIGELVETDGPFDGVVMDLGVSSPQLDHGERGFSFQHDGPLDMRMDPEEEVSARDLLEDLSEEELARVIYQLGDEKASRRIARAIVQEREKSPLETTAQLAELVGNVVGFRKHKKIHPATKTFQAIRMEVNDELGALDSALGVLPDLLRPGGRMAVISFHALEDRRVKRMIQHRSQEEIRGEGVPFGNPNPDWCLKSLGRWKPSDEEIAQNPRARSARLRGAEKLPEQPTTL